MMLNLHSYLPDQYTDDEFVMINLENLYKERSRESHEVALEAIFAEGVKYANEVFEVGMDEYNELKTRYDSLLAKVTSVNVGGDEALAQKEAVAQTLGMGKVFEL